MSEERKEKVKRWLKDRENLYLIGMLSVAIFIRLYYFFMTADQTLWWDEAEYMSIAKNFAFGIPYDISPQRLVLFPFLASLIYRLGLGELSIKFLLVLVPSILIVILTYKFVREMYNKKTALLTTFITSLCWIHLFYSMRVMNNEIEFLFGMLGLYYFWRGYISSKNNKYVYLSAFFISLSFLIRPTGIYYAAILILFLFATEQFRFLKKKELWLMVLIFFIVLSPHMIWSQIYHGNALAFRTAYGGPDTKGMTLFGSTIFMLKFVYDYPELIFFIFFLIGLLTLFPMLISFDKVLKGSKKYQNDLLMIISVLFVLIFSILVLRSAENRWLMAMSLGIFVFSAKGILLTFNLIKKHLGKSIAITILILILLSGTYYQLGHADSIIKAKIPTYAPVKEAALWIKENSEPGDIIFSRSWPQNNYYSERETFTFDAYSTDESNMTDLIRLLQEKKPRYYVMSIFEPKGEWMFEIPQKYQEAFKPVQGYKNGDQAVLIIYQIDYTKPPFSG